MLALLASENRPLKEKERGGGGGVGRGRLAVKRTQSSANKNISDYANLKRVRWFSREEDYKFTVLLMQTLNLIWFAGLRADKLIINYPTLTLCNSRQCPDHK